MPHSLADARVGLVRAGPSGYARAAPELAAAWRRLSDGLGWSSPELGGFGRVVPQGAAVVVKPNLVSHRNQGPGGLEPLVTHPALIELVVAELLQSGAGSVLVGDAPIQGCDWELLLEATRMGAWARELAAQESRFLGVRDFRRTVSTFAGRVRIASEDRIAASEFVLFDLGRESLLEPISQPPGRFRVTLYDPALMARTHGPGRHQYLIARAVLEADVVVNLPKLKTHKKSGITCALKNLVGINGNKEFLPHHRVGGSANGGDCYPGRHPMKRLLESALDRQNSAASAGAAWAWSWLALQLGRAARLAGDRLGVEGSWSGNDTVWRMALDLNRILLYGRTDATLADTPQRRVLHVVDAVIAGQGDGPLAPDPLALGLLLGAENAAALDWVGAQLLGYEPARVPLVAHAFDRFPWPLTGFGAEQIRVLGDLGSGPPEAALTGEQPFVKYPLGWVSAARRPVTDGTGRPAPFVPEEPA